MGVDMKSVHERAMIYNELVTATIGKLLAKAVCYVDLMLEQEILCVVKKLKMWCWIVCRCITKGVPRTSDEWENWVWSYFKDRVVNDLYYVKADNGEWPLNI